MFLDEIKEWAGSRVLVLKLNGSRRQVVNLPDCGGRLSSLHVDNHGHLHLCAGTRPAHALMLQHYCSGE